MTLTRPRRIAAAFAALTLTSAAAWAGLDSPPAVPRLPRSTAPAARAERPRAEGVRRFAVRAEGTAAVTLTAPLETIRGGASALGGWVDLDAADLRRSRGEVDVDLGTFATHTFGDERDATQTLHARNWFEIGDGVEHAQRERLRWARYRITAVVSASVTSLADAPATREGGAEAREAALEVDGVLTVHGIEAHQRASLAVRVITRGDASTLEVTTRRPLRIRLRDHDVRPRDAGGSLITRTLAALGQKVAEVAEVTLTARGDTQG